MKLSVYHKIDEIAEELWDDILPEDDVFQRHKFLSALQAAGVENARMAFLCFFENGRLEGTAVVSVFHVNLSLFAGENKFIKWMEKAAPGIFRTRICFCGTPLSAGQNHIRSRDPAQENTIIKMTAEFMDQWCAKAKIPIAIFKEFGPGHVSASLSDQGYFSAHSLPGMHLSLPFEDYITYLGSLKSAYRRQITNGWKKLGGKPPVFIPNYFQTPQNEAFPVFTILEGDQLNGDKFYGLYHAVLQRSKSRLETLNPSFFRNVFCRYRKDLVGLCMMFRGKIIGIFILMKTSGKLLFLWTGREAGKDKYDSYTNMLSALVIYSLRQGYSGIDLGQTSYYPKLRLGARPYVLEFYCKGRKKWLHKLLRYYRPVLFPEYSLPEVKVFNAKTAKV